MHLMTLNCIRLKMVRVVNFVLSVFYHQKQTNKKTKNND